MPDEREANRPTIQFGREFDLLLAGMTTGGFVALLLVVIASVVAIFQDGTSPRGVFLVGGAVLSAMALFGYGALQVRKADKETIKSGIGPMSLAIGGLVPYAFGCYLVFYEGLWGFWLLFDVFALHSLVGSTFYLIAGYFVVSAIYRVSQLGRALDEGRILVRKGIAT